MKWDIQLNGHDVRLGLEWARRFFDCFDTSQVQWLRIDPGSGAYEGVYGRCYYPTKRIPHYRISCHVPGPFPCRIRTRKPPLYQKPGGTFPRTPSGCRRGVMCHDVRTGKTWIRLTGHTLVNTFDEGVVWIVAHEAFHFLRRTRQVPGRNNEIEADRFADLMLEQFRRELMVRGPAFAIGA